MKLQEDDQVRQEDKRKLNRRRLRYLIDDGMNKACMQGYHDMN